jgi:hypothetical protein
MSIAAIATVVSIGRRAWSKEKGRKQKKIEELKIKMGKR